MDAVEYVKALRRLCISQSGCNACQLNGKNGCIVSNMDKEAEKAVPIVEQWAKDHPVKTRQSEFFKMFPKAPMKDDVIDICPATVVKGLKNAEHCNHILCEDCRKTFWLMEVADND